MYSGFYFGVLFVNHVYEPSQMETNQLSINHKHRLAVGQLVMFRQKHKRCDIGVVEDIGYSSEKNKGGTIKVYRIKNKWVSEKNIKHCVEA